MRIIAGEFRGRRLTAPKGRNTRPTPDRVREALFSILGDRVIDAEVAELFGGTGSLGLESLSRGAAGAVFFETDRAARECLEQNILTLGVGDRARLLRRSAFDVGRALPPDHRFDIVFCDPPHRLIDEPRERRRLEELFARIPLAQDGLVLLEHRAGAIFDFSPPGFVLCDTRTWGTTGIAFYSRPV